MLKKWNQQHVLLYIFYIYIICSSVYAITYTWCCIHICVCIILTVELLIVEFIGRELAELSSEFYRFWIMHINWFDSDLIHSWFCVPNDVNCCFCSCFCCWCYTCQYILYVPYMLCILVHKCKMHMIRMYRGCRKWYPS